MIGTKVLNMTSYPIITNITNYT